MATMLTNEDTFTLETTSEEGKPHFLPEGEFTLRVEYTAYIEPQCSDCYFTVFYEDTDEELTDLPCRLDAYITQLAYLHCEENGHTQKIYNAF
jgi:hypothetical protein